QVVKPEDIHVTPVRHPHVAIPGRQMHAAGGGLDLGVVDDGVPVDIPRTLHPDALLCLGGGGDGRGRQGEDRRDGGPHLHWSSLHGSILLPDRWVGWVARPSHGVTSSAPMSAAASRGSPSMSSSTSLRGAASTAVESGCRW